MEELVSKFVYWIMTSLVLLALGLFWYLYKRINSEQDKRMSAIEIANTKDRSANAKDRDRILTLEVEWRYMRPVLESLEKGVARLNETLVRFETKQDSMVESMEGLSREVKEQTGRFTLLGDRMVRLENKG
jgi:predicted  nucleic acid-binding Zn-ribbon protein